MYKLNVFFISFSLFFSAIANNTDKEIETNLKIEEQTNQIEKNIYSKSKDAVVKIYNNSNVHNFLEPYKIPENAKGVGTGFFINEDGYILTCYHVVEGAKKIYINIPSQGQKQFNCEIVGAYPERDVALIKLKDKDLNTAKESLGQITYLNLGDSDQLIDSQDLMVLGYPLASDTIQLSEGIFAGKDKDLLGFETLHTTAPINPGNSGGPVIDENGNVIGMCVLKIMFSEGMGYLVPMDEIKNVLDDMFDEKIVRYPFWGIHTTEKITEETIKYLSNGKLDHGIFVQTLIKNSLSDKYGIKKNDLIYEIDGFPIDIHGDIQLASKEKMNCLTYLNKVKFWDQIVVSILRDGQEITLNVTKEPGNDFGGLKKIYPELNDKIDYEILDGIVIMPLLGNHLEIRGLFQELGISPQEYLYKNFSPLLIITHVSPDSSASEMSFTDQSRVIKKINGIDVETLNELREIVKKTIEEKNEYLVIENHIGGVIAIPIETVIESYNELSDSNINFTSPIFDEVLVEA